MKDRIQVLLVACLTKGGEIRDTKTLNLSRNIVAFQVFGQCFSFFTLQDQLVAQQRHLLRVDRTGRQNLFRFQKKADTS